MKKCINCGTISDENVKYCTQCGSNYFEPYINTIGNVNIAGKNKNRKKGKIVITAGSIISLLAIAIPIAVNIGLREHRKNKLNDEETSSINQVISNIDSYLDSKTFTKGEIIQDTYKNEWANIEFKIPDKFPPYSDMSKYDSDRIKTGYASINSETGEYFILEFYNFEDVDEYFDEKRFLNTLFEKSIKPEDNADKDSYEISDDYYTKIAGEEYLTRDIYFKDIDLIQKYCTFKKEKQVIVFEISAYDATEIEEIINSISIIN